MENEHWRVAKAPGSYILVLHLAVAGRIGVGALGMHDFAPGYYLYVGSALNGLAGRLRRHVRSGNKKLHWHIDYLRAYAELTDVWWAVSDERLECVWAAAMRQGYDPLEPVAGFGASDCRCYSHLFYFQDQPSWSDFVRMCPGDKLHRKRLICL